MKRLRYRISGHELNDHPQIRYRHSLIESMVYASAVDMGLLRIVPRRGLEPPIPPDRRPGVS